MNWLGQTENPRLRKFRPVSEQALRYEELVDGILGQRFSKLLSESCKRQSLGGKTSIQLDGGRQVSRLADKSQLHGDQVACFDTPCRRLGVRVLMGKSKVQERDRGKRWGSRGGLRLRVAMKVVTL